MCVYIYIYIYVYVCIYIYIYKLQLTIVRDTNYSLRILHPVSITRFPLRKFSPGAGLLRNLFVHR